MRYAAWRTRLDAIAAAHQTRTLRTLTPTSATTAQLDGQDVIVACSNDYLGLAWHPDVRGAAAGGGSGSSRLVSGTRPVHRELEGAVEDWLGRPALLFTSGYHANLAVFSTVVGPEHRVCSDALNHASIIDGLRLGRGQRVVVPHADPDAIDPDAQMIVVEGLYSMDGDVPPFARYPTRPWLAVDEAHAVGCLGPQGRGTAARAGVLPDIVIGTFGKAFGAHGAFVSGPPELIELLVNAGRSFIFTTALPEPVAAMALAGLHRATDALREQLSHNVQYFRSGLEQRGWSPLGEAHIVPVVVGSGALELSARLLTAGVWVPAIRWPTVARGEERLRFTLSAAHTTSQLDQVLDALGAASAGQTVSS